MNGGSTTRTLPPMDCGQSILWRKGRCINIPLNDGGHGAVHSHSDVVGTDYALFDSLYSARFDAECLRVTDTGYLEISGLDHGQYVLSSLNPDIPTLTAVVSPGSGGDVDADGDGDDEEEETKEDGTEGAADGNDDDVSLQRAATATKGASSRLVVFDRYYQQLSPSTPLQLCGYSGPLN